MPETTPPPGEPFPVEEILAMCGEEAQRAFREQSAIYEMEATMSGAQRPGDALRAAGIEPVNPFEFICRLHLGVRVTPLIAEELAKQTGCTPQFWLNMQEAFDGR